MPKENGDKVRFAIRNTTKGKLPRLPFPEMKKVVLGSEYNLSLVFATDRLSQTLNFTYRGKNKPTNVLSFALSETAGEIFITLSAVRREAQDSAEKYETSVGYLFIHAMLHLKGMTHGSRMEKAEKKLRKKFKF